MTWRPSEPPTDLPADTAHFLATLDAHVDLFNPSAPLVVARAPGRLDLMGGIADYSGSLVLELPLTVAAHVAAQLAPEPLVTIHSGQAEAIGAAPQITLALDDLAPGGRPLDYAAARALLKADPRAHWAAYIAGALVVLGHERGQALDRGMRLLVDSQVPPGKGVSSSAAIEVAAMQAVAALWGVELEGRELALLCQKVENLIVGAPCGVMDQMTAACGEQDRLLALLCQPAELEPPVALPPELEVWGVDSGIRHAVSGADYGSVRVGAFMGYRVIAELAGLTARPASHDAPLTIDDPHWHGYLANVTPSAWEQHYRQLVPEALSGAAFLGRYGGTTDTVTRVDPGRVYAVREPTAHPIYEHHRVRLFRALLESLTNDQRPTTNDQRLPLSAAKGPTTTNERSFVVGPSSFVETAVLLGELMYQSHASYSACGLGSSGTDRLVELVRAAGAERSLYGAKITGGGSGGTVAVLGRRGAEEALQAIAAQYERESGYSTTLLSGSSRGATAFGVLHLAATDQA